MNTHKLIYINSVDRKAGQNINDFVYHVTDQEILNKDVDLYLVNFVSKICIPVITSANNTFVLNENGTIVSISLTTDQSPDWITLGTELQTKLNFYSPNHYTYAVTEDSAKLHFLISVNSANPISFDFTCLNSVYKILGFEQAIYSFVLQSLESTKLVDLGGDYALFIRIKNGTGDDVVDFANVLPHTLCIIPYLASYGSSLFFQNIDSDYNAKIDTLNSLEIQITDFYGNLLPFNYDYFITLKVTIIGEELNDLLKLNYLTDQVSEGFKHLYKKKNSYLFK